MTDSDHRAEQDPILEAAFDWLFALRAAPDDKGMQTAFAAWRAAAPAHADAYRQAEDVWQLTGAAPRVEMPPAMPRIIAAPVANKTFKRPALWLGLAAAAVITVIAFPGIHLRLTADYRTASAETRQISLPDGSVVTLDADSAIALGDQINARGVELLSGRAFFDVAKDKQLSFVVKAGDVDITVHGTTFDVLMTDPTVSVAVAEGAVSVEAGGKSMDLKPGDRVSVDAMTGKMQLQQMSVANVAAWRQGQLVVQGATIGEIVDELRRYHTGAILLRDGAFAEQRVTGVFDLRDPLGALQGLARAYGGRVESMTPYLLLVTSG